MHIEILKLSKLIHEYNKILNSKKELYNVIKSELLNIKDKYSVPRRTKIIDAVLNYNIEHCKLLQFNWNLNKYSKLTYITGNLRYAAVKNAWICGQSHKWP